jgi:hypothetical protein
MYTHTHNADDVCPSLLSSDEHVAMNASDSGTHNKIYFIFACIKIVFLELEKIWKKYFHVGNGCGYMCTKFDCDMYKD